VHESTGSGKTAFFIIFLIEQFDLISKALLKSSYSPGKALQCLLLKSVPGKIILNTLNPNFGTTIR
jgi:hypothetical protein